MDAKMYVRFPRDENPSTKPWQIPYTCEREPFDELVDPEPHESEWRLLVVRPVPYGEGRLRMTGEIVYDVIDIHSSGEVRAA